MVSVGRMVLRVCLLGVLLQFVQCDKISDAVRRAMPEYLTDEEMSLLTRYERIYMADLVRAVKDRLTTDKQFLSNLKSILKTHANTAMYSSFYTDNSLPSGARVVGLGMTVDSNTDYYVDFDPDTAISIDNSITFKEQEGVKGTSGQPGREGVGGAKGDDGDRGEKGQQGEKGEKGVQGRAGSRGPVGFPGITGERGEMGQKGEKGVMGRELIRIDDSASVMAGQPKGSDGAIFRWGGG